MKLIDLHSEGFSAYGTVITEKQVSTGGRQALVDFFHLETEAPSEGNVYVADVPMIHEMAVAKELSAVLDYEEPQFGYCHGNSTKVNALEWHDCQELVLAATDTVLFLGHPDALVEVEGKLQFSTEQLVAVKLHKGDIIRLNPRVLHFAPIKVTNEPFRTMIVLDKGTNTPLESEGEGHLFMTNKWMIAHKERPDLIAKGAWPGVIGINYDWKEIKDTLQ